MADRYTYLPLIGIFMIAAWGGAELVRQARAAAFAAAVAVAACSVVAWFQVGYWKSSITLFEHTLRVTENNYLAHACLGIALAEAGRGEAIPHYREALRVNPHYSQAEASLGLALAQSGSTGEAIDHYREALRLRPSRIEVMNNLAWLRATARDPRFRNSSEAVELAERACRMTGYGNANYLDTLAAAYAEAGQTAQAVQIGERAVQLALSTRQPDLARTIEERTKLYRAGHAYRE
jgi:Flp pilus assembly protein TadD